LTSLPQINQDDYYNRSYEDISKEFQTLFSSAIRAFQLVPLMYNRLTRVDNLSHSTAVERIYNDHHHMPGFSRRSITRYLPADNPAVPHRVTPSWRKKSSTYNESTEKSSVNEQYEGDLDDKVDKSIARPSALDNAEISIAYNVNTAHVLTRENKKQESFSGVTHLQELPNQDRDKIKELNNRISNVSSITAEEVVSAMNASADNVDFEFSLLIEEIQQHISSIASDGELPDRLWINGSVNKVTGKVIEIQLGRIEQNFV
jgi:hypothetical protein